MNTDTEKFDAEYAVEAMVNQRHPRKQAAAEWAAANLTSSDIVERDVSCEFWAQGWQRAAEHGITRLMVDKKYGGTEDNIFDGLLTFEGLGYGCNDAGLVFALATQVWTMQPAVERFGSPSQRQRLLPGLCSGKLKGAFSITEADAGSDIFSLTTTAIKSEDGSQYVLNGQKSYVTLAPEADVFVVFATSDPKLGQWGISAFCIPADNPGLVVGPNRPKMGLRTTPFADLTLENCVVEAADRLGPEGSGAAVFSAAMEMERAFLLVCQLGAMERQLDQAVAFSRSRRQFSQPIGDFQAVSHRLADMKLAYDNTRLQLYRAATLQATGQPSMTAAALANIQASEAAVASSMSALLTHGARGYVSEFGIEQDVRNTVGGLVYGGTLDIQRNIIARMLADESDS